MFISWSGRDSGDAARALQSWIPRVLQTVEPFVSSEDVAAGDIWFGKISRQLRDSRFAIICVTPENLDRPWLHFEAGAIGMSHVGPDGLTPPSVVPLLLGLTTSELDPPLSLYQAVTADKGGIQRLMLSLNELAPVTLSGPELRAAVDRWWPDLESELTRIRTQIENGPAPRVQRDDRELLEEILALVRSPRPSASKRREKRRIPVSDINLVLTRAQSAGFDVKRYRRYDTKDGTPILELEVAEADLEDESLEPARAALSEDLRLLGIPTVLFSSWLPEDDQLADIGQDPPSSS